MASSIGFHFLRYSCAVNEVEVFLDRSTDHARGSVGFVSRVAVHQHVNIGVNVCEHATDDIPFSLTRLLSGHGPS